MLDGFVPYIYEGELYGKLGMNMPRLTPGALLLRMTRLERLHNRMKDAQLRTYQALRNQFTSLTTEWQQAYRKKNWRGKRPPDCVTCKPIWGNAKMMRAAVRATTCQKQSGAPSCTRSALC